MSKEYIKRIAGKISPAKRWHTHDFPHSSQAAWQRVRSNLGRQTTDNPLVNSAYQALSECPCGNGTPAMSVMDGFVYFECSGDKADNKLKACGRYSKGVPTKKGARWLAAQQWNDMISNPPPVEAAAVAIEAEAHTVIPNEEEWLQRHWSHHMGAHKLKQRR